MKKKIAFLPLKVINLDMENGDQVSKLRYLCPQILGGVITPRILGGGINPKTPHIFATAFTTISTLNYKLIGVSLDI